MSIALALIVLSIAPCHAQNRDPTWRVVICSGILRDSEVGQAEARTMAGLSSFFADQLGLGREAVTIVCDSESQAFDANAVACTRENLKKTLVNLAAAVRPVDRFMLYYTGQANRADDTLRLNVRGPDIVHSELAQWLGAIEAKEKLVVLDCPCAGLAIKDLSDPNSIVVCSARGDQYDSPRFSDYFVPALLHWQPEADDDGRFSLLEVFQKTSRDLDAYYAQEKCYKSENALLEDDGDGVPSQQPWLFEQTGKDGARAAQFYFRQILATPPERGH